MSNALSSAHLAESACDERKRREISEMCADENVDLLTMLGRIGENYQLDLEAISREFDRRGSPIPLE